MQLGGGTDINQALAYSQTLALSDDGAPAYDHGNAAALAALGCPVFACTPEQFPPLIAAAIEGRDIDPWAAGQGIAGARGR
jgi:hypothetical protein